MILWMSYTLLAAALLAGAALALEETMKLLRAPRRWGWIGGMLAATLLPAFFRFLPADPEPGVAATLDPGTLAALLAQASIGNPAAPTGPHLLLGRATDLLLLGGWALGALAVSAALVITWRRLARLRRSATVVEIAGEAALLTESMGPMVVGVRRPEVVVPRWIETLTEKERRLVIQHEREHARAGDPRLLMAAAVLLAAMPWNLPLWWMRWRLRQSIEVDCDARVLAGGADRRLYGSILIRTAGRPSPAPLLAPALVELPSLLERRIIAMTDKNPLYRRARLAVAIPLGLLLFVAACELTPRGSSPSPTEPTLAEVLDAEEVLIDEAASVPADSMQASVNAIILRRQGEEPAEVLVNGSHGLRADSIRIRVRPGEAFAGTANPLIIVDGERLRDSSLSAMDPQGILRIEVLKDAAATDRFGEEARDGAVLVTTRAGAGLRERDPAPTVPATGAPEGSVRVRGEAPVVYENIVAVGYGTVPRTQVPAAEAEPVARSAAPVVLNETNAVGYGTAPREQVTAAVAESPRAAASGDPLILVDGEVVPTMADFSARFQPRDIDSITVLKDTAAAVARYGARAEHGAIIITLKK